MKTFKRIILMILFDKETRGYLTDALQRDESFMLRSKESLTGYHDLDIEINRKIAPLL